MNRQKQDTELLKSLADWARATPAALAKRAGVAVSTINRPFSATATTQLSRTTLEKLQAAFPDFPGWADRNALQGPMPFRSNVRIPAEDDADLVSLPEIDLRYGMGASYVDLPVSAELRQFSRAWLSNFTRASPEHLFWATGDGDSMEPTIRSGETILIDTSQKTPRMNEGIWAMAIGEIGMIKRLHFAGRDGIELRSDNSVIPPIPVTPDELHVIGRVIAVVRRL